MTTAPFAKGRFFFAAFVFGSFVRAVIFSQTETLGTPIKDEQHYSQLATHILRGDGLAWEPGRLTSIRPPLYPALVAAVWAISGVGNLQAVRFVQLVPAALTAVVICRLGREVFGPAVGRGAAVVYWLYPSFILALYATAFVTTCRSISWQAHRLALAGAIAGIAVLVVIWVRQIVTVDSGYSRSLLHLSS